MPRPTSRLILFNKPFGVLSQFSHPSGDCTDPPPTTLARYIDIPDVYPAGRLDKDSEGLLLLTNDGVLQQRIAHPAGGRWKVYQVQVEGLPTDAQLATLRAGVALKDGPTRPARVQRIAPPDLWPRDPPVRYRKSVPDAWLELAIREGRNRQVRRMTAAVGLPTLRLVRIAVGDWRLDGLLPGAYRELTVPAPRTRPGRRPAPRQRR